MVSDSEGEPPGGGSSQVSAALVLDGSSGGFGRCCLRSLGSVHCFPHEWDS